MKKILAILMCLGVMGFVFASTANAENESSTLLNFKNDLTNGEDFGQSLFIKHQNASWGAGLDIDFTAETDYFSLQPFATFNLNQGSPWYLVGGFTTDSRDSDYVDAGMQYVNRWSNGFSSFVDIRNYWSLNNSGDYLSIFTDFAYSINEKWGVGVQLCWNNYWKEDHDFYLAGPVLSYKITDAVQVYGRVSRSWNVLEGNVADWDTFRLGFKIFF